MARMVRRRRKSNTHSSLFSRLITQLEQKVLAVRTWSDSSLLRHLTQSLTHSRRSDSDCQMKKTCYNEWTFPGCVSVFQYSVREPIRCSIQNLPSLSPQGSGEGYRDRQWCLEKQKKGLASRLRHMVGCQVWKGLSGCRQDLWGSALPTSLK